MEQTSAALLILVLKLVNLRQYKLVLVLTYRIKIGRFLLWLESLLNGNTCAYTSAKIRGTNAVNNGDVVGSHAFDGYDGGTFRTMARIDGVVSSSVSSNSISGDLAFRTRTGSTQSEVLRITGDGKLTMSSGTVELQEHMVRVGNRTTSN